MPKFAALCGAIFLTAFTCWADTIVSGGSSYTAYFGPQNGQFDQYSTTFNLVLSGGQFTSVNAFAAGVTSPGPSFETGFNIDYEFGISTQLVSVTLNGANYPVVCCSPPGYQQSYSASLSLIPISGTNIVPFIPGSTASGVYQITGDVSADLGGAVYTDSFSGYAYFTGSYNTFLPGNPVDLVFQESYTFSPTLTPEPTTFCEMVGVLGASLGLAAIRRYRLDARAQC